MSKKKSNIEQEKSANQESRYISARNALVELVSTIYDQLHAGEIPRMVLPLRSKQNIQFDLRSGVWKLNTATLTRSCKKLDGALGILRAINIIDFIDEMIKTNKSSTLRELYYISEQWNIAKFHGEDESNRLIEDLEIITKHLREDFKLRPEENGASIIGNITIEETDRKGKVKRINCRDDVGDGGYALPYNVEKDKIKIVDWDAKFVLGIECLDGNEKVIIQNLNKIKKVRIGEFIDNAFLRYKSIKRGNSKFVPVENENFQALSVSQDGKLEWKKITKLIRHKVEAPRLKVETQYGFNITVTPNHYIMCYNNFEITTKKVTELQSSDLVAVATSISTKKNIRTIIPKKIRKFKVTAFPTKELNTPDLINIFRKYIPSNIRMRLYHKLNYQDRISYSTLAGYLEYIPDGISEKIKFVKNVVSSGVSFLPIKNIQPVESESKTVYDIEVEDNHTFVAGFGNICVHNCGGMFDRLVENGFDEKFDAVLVHLKGQPARCTRRFIKRLNTECNLPVLVFTDGDPWSFRIFASIAYGAIKTAHISEYLATPTAQFLGVTASDIENYALPSDKLNDKDIKALHAEQSDPRFADDFWKQEIQLMLDINKKAEQQSLAKYGLNFVTDKYLPEKLSTLLF